MKNLTKAEDQVMHSSKSCDRRNKKTKSITIIMKSRVENEKTNSYQLFAAGGGNTY